MSNFALSEVQSQAILDMRLKRLTGLEKSKIEEEIARLQKSDPYLFEDDIPNGTGKDGAGSGSDANGTYRCTAPGEARLQDGKWVVTRKAVVIFD